MFYKTLKTSESGKLLKSIMDSANKAKKAAREYTKSIGAVDYFTSNYYLEGSPVAFSFPTRYKIPAYFKRFNHSPNAWSPRLTSKEGKAMQVEINALPRVKWDVLATAFGEARCRGVSALATVKDVYLITLQPSASGKGMPMDCVKIKESEFLMLQGR